ncbi:MAG: copper chaperone PCu(A)C [Hydrogenophilaceae bacterium]|nr:copper chaperone PCu(A)C [Hydrogenophilaceae bacterium]
MRIGSSLFRAGAAAIALLALAACGQSPKEAPADEQAAAQPIAIEGAWAAASPSGASVAAGYAVIRNNAAAPDRLTSASSPRAGRVEFHEMVMIGDVMRMGPMAQVEIPAGGSMTLAPGGDHIMFIDIAAPFVEGESVPLTLTFEHAGAIELSLPVRPRLQPSAH